MNEDKIRADFEEWVVKNCPDLKLTRDSQTGGYCWHGTHCAYVGWQAALATRPDINQLPENGSDRWQDSELEMLCIDGYHGKEHTNYVSSGDPKHIAGLRAIAVKAMWAAANKINSSLCDKVAELEKQIATAFDVNQELVEALEASIERMECDEVQIDGEWGACRDLAKIEADGDLSPTIIQARKALAKHKEKNLTIEDLASHEFDTSEYIPLNDGIRRVYDSPAKYKAGDAGFTEEEIVNLITPHTGYYLADKTGLRLAEEMAKPIINDLKAANALRLRGE